MMAITVDERAALIRDLADAGLNTIEAGSFVSPRWVPQMAGTADVVRKVGRIPGVTLPALVPNLQGLQVAAEAGVECIALFAAATEGFSRANLNASKADAFARFAAVAKQAVARGMKARGYGSCAVHCPFDGWVEPQTAAELAYRLMEIGCYQVTMCDTTGRSTVGRALAMADAAISAVSAASTAVHFHNTGSLALQCSAACIELGISTVDSAAAGLGGCPYSPGAEGNLATENLVDMLDASGFQHGVDRQKLASVGQRICAILGRSGPSDCARPASIMCRR